MAPKPSWKEACRNRSSSAGVSCRAHFRNDCYFWTPELFHGVSVAGYHLHFLSTNSPPGGHVSGFWSWKWRGWNGTIAALEQLLSGSRPRFSRCQIECGGAKRRYWEIGIKGGGVGLRDHTLSLNSLNRMPKVGIQFQLHLGLSLWSTERMRLGLACRLIRWRMGIISKLRRPRRRLI